MSEQEGIPAQRLVSFHLADPPFVHKIPPMSVRVFLVFRIQEWGSGMPFTSPESGEGHWQEMLYRASVLEWSWWASWRWLLDPPRWCVSSPTGRRPWGRALSWFGNTSGLPRGGVWKGKIWKISTCVDHQLSPSDFQQFVYQAVNMFFFCWDVLTWESMGTVGASAGR